MWNQQSLADALSISSKVINNFTASSVVIDSRIVQPGSIFVAIIGPNQDGHNYVKQAIEAGATFCIVEKKNVVPPSFPHIIVDDSFDCLCKMAKHARARMNGVVIGITGSSGKTSLKEMLRCILSEQGKTYVTKGNLNNHYGVPLTLANMPIDTEFAAIEMGMSAAGEIMSLTKMAKPDIAIINNVGAAHAEFFTSIEAIAEAKAEIIAGLPIDGTLVTNFDNPYHHIIMAHVPDKTVKVIGFSMKAPSDFQLLQIDYNPGGMSIKAACLGRTITYSISTYGNHMALNSLAALAAAHAAGADLQLATEQLKHFNPVIGRGMVHQFAKRNITIIDESYNANPTSVAATIEAAAMRKQHSSRIIAALGDMKELGPESIDLHRGLLKPLIDNKIDCVYTVGPLMKELFNILPTGVIAKHYDNSMQLAEAIPSLLQDGDIVLIKGSLSMDMKKVLDKSIKHLEN